jgi:pimeloyl-ACP methyl ester carboxylesterase
MQATDKIIYQDGPWQHQKIIASANAFHIVVAGERTSPLILLLHGFGQYWYTWRDYILPLAQQGYRVAAVDLRGYGDSDKPPRGYDPRTISHDIAAIIRTLGAKNAVVIGHDWGGLAAWAAAKHHPDLINSLVVVNAPHPDALIDNFLKDKKTRNFFWLLTRMQIKTIAYRKLTNEDAELLEQWLQKWNNYEWPDPALARRYRLAFLNRVTPLTAIEYYRWAARSLLRLEGRKFYRKMRRPINQNVLAISTLDDPLIEADLVQMSKKYVKGIFTYKQFATGGHHVHERSPEQVLPVIVNWLAQLRNS